jgi:hypothetical protein
MQRKTAHELWWPFDKIRSAIGYDKYCPAHRRQEIDALWDRYRLDDTHDFDFNSKIGAFNEYADYAQWSAIKDDRDNHLINVELAELFTELGYKVRTKTNTHYGTTHDVVYFKEEEWMRISGLQYGWYWDEFIEDSKKTDVRIKLIFGGENDSA